MVADGKVVYEAHDNANMALSVKAGFFFYYYYYYLLMRNFNYHQQTKLFIQKTLAKLKRL